MKKQTTSFGWLVLLATTACLALLSLDSLEAKGRRARRSRSRCCSPPPCCAATPPTTVAAPAATHLTAAPAAPAVKWTSLFDGKTLKGWKSTEFGGQGKVEVEKGHIVIPMGYSMSGVTWQDEFPKSNYELRMEATRLEGIDFFCGLTFPVKSDHCSFIVGGWAGAVVGLSSIDGEDASENETTSYMNFKKGQWYRIRVKVTDDRIQCWIDDKQVVDQDIRGRKLTIRPEVELSRPLGICTWETKAGLRKLEYRKLEPKKATAKAEPK